MQAVRIHPNPANPYTPENPAPASALHLDHGISIPKPSKHDDVLVRIKASTLIRDTLSWPEMLSKEYMIPGNDFSGIVEAVADEKASGLKVGDEVFGMTDANSGGAWAEYALVDATKGEVAKKAPHISFEQAASAPLSALTAWQALFHKAGIPPPTSSGSSAGKGTKVLITGASGGVGIFLVQLAALAGCHVIAASTSNARNAEFLHSLGADEILEYSQLSDRPSLFDVAIDTVGGEPLSKIWSIASQKAKIVSVDTSSYDFANSKEASARPDIEAIWFIVWTSAKDLSGISELLEDGRLKTFVAKQYPLAKASEAYETTMGRSSARGKIILTV